MLQAYFPRKTPSYKRITYFRYTNDTRQELHVPDIPIYQTRTILQRWIRISGIKSIWTNTNSLPGDHSWLPLSESRDISHSEYLCIHRMPCDIRRNSCIERFYLRVIGKARVIWFSYQYKKVIVGPPTFWCNRDIGISLSAFPKWITRTNANNNALKIRLLFVIAISSMFLAKLFG